MSFKDSQTEQNLKDAFAGESQANRRYLYFAAKADVEGYNDVAAVFRSTAEGETGHAHGHLEYLEETGDPATGLPIGGTGDNLGDDGLEICGRDRRRDRIDGGSAAAVMGGEVVGARRCHEGCALGEDANGLLLRGAQGLGQHSFSGR